ncbi:unnamed protein product [Cuscuta campestris]|uniref:CCHC-type domain-containing protein n=1 Tax=Cuscuta campestris TaxID=132261 RepID=A0A484KBM3_9ASTE|nr:unnamed protein product [Cuscuta campestris]
MASVKSSNVSVEPFDGRGDFTLWKQRVKSVLTREGTIKALKVKVQRTEKMTDAEWAKHRKNDKPEKLSEEEWEDLKDMAICLCLANNTLRELGLTDPVDIWDKLESRYKSKSLTSRLYLKKRLFGLQMAEEANFNGHLDEFNKITTELESIDVKIEEEDKALLLLASLPSSFDNIVTTLLQIILFGRLYLKKRLFGLQMAEEANFNGHLDEFNKITTELESIDVKIEEEDKALLLLASLPSSFDNIVTTLLFGKETLKFDEVVAALLMNETRRGGNGVSNDGQALVAKGAGRERGRSKERGGASQRFQSSSKSFRCYYCDEEGHFKRDCPKRRKEKKDGKTPVTTVAESSNQESEEDLFLATAKSLGKSDWILDSGCSFHMCSVKEKFDTYQTCDGGALKMANGARRKIAGVGTVQVRMFDGVVRTLTGVKHVPGLKGNVISLGALDSEGYRIFAKGGVLKISRGAMVVAKGVLSKGLYKLVGKDLTRKLSKGKITSATSGAFAWKKRVTFKVSPAGGSCDLAGTS